MLLKIIFSYKKAQNHVNIVSDSILSDTLTANPIDS